MPPVDYTPESFGANDTSYIHVLPDWSAESMGYSAGAPMTISDMALGIDGYIFMADSANDRVLVVNQSGALLDFQNLDKITPINGPVGVAIDAKLNLLIVNNTNKIFVWNQYINYTGIDSVLKFDEAHPNGYFDADQAVIDSLLGISVFYEDEDLSARFNSVAFGPKNDNLVYATDRAGNRIVELKMNTTGAVRLSNGYMHRIFTASYERNIAEQGSGAGTVDTPLSLACDADGSVYFTQLGGNFLVQKLKRSGNTFSPAFTLYEHEIMDLERFKGPTDIALDGDNDIFVIDAADSGRVSKFFNHGLSIGAVSDLGREGLSRARFDAPRSILVSSDGVVYIANTGQGRIERYRYTISNDDLPEEKP